MALPCPTKYEFFHLSQEIVPNPKLKNLEKILGQITFFLSGDFFQSSITQLKFGARKSLRPFLESSDHQLLDEHFRF